MAIPASGGNPTGSGNQGGKRILVVDDERHIVRLAQVNLEKTGNEWSRRTIAKTL